MEPPTQLYAQNIVAYSLQPLWSSLYSLLTFNFSFTNKYLTLNNQIKMLLIPAIGGLDVLTSIICLFATIRCLQQLILRMSTYIRQTPCYQTQGVCTIGKDLL